MKYQYCVDHDCVEGTESCLPDYSFEFKWNSDDVEDIAAEAAEDYFRNHDGWECDWPLTFVIFDGGEVIGKCEVELEHNPSFSASRLD